MYAVYVAPALAFAVIVVLYLRFREVLRWRRHDPIEYYSGLDGYRFALPLRLVKKITSEEAQALSAAGHSYYAGYFSPDGHLIRAVKMQRGKADFEHTYAYSPKGRLMRAAIIQADGAVSLLGGTHVALEDLRETPAGYLDQPRCLLEDKPRDQRMGERIR